MIYYDIKLSVKGIQPKSVLSFDIELQGHDQKEFTLVYAPGRAPGAGHDLHSVYVRSYDQQAQRVTCINSWGQVDKYPKLDLKDVEYLYRVECSTVDATQQSKIYLIRYCKKHSKNSFRSFSDKSGLVKYLSHHHPTGT